MSFILLMFFFFIANLFYLIILWNNSLLNIIYPTFINSSEEIDYFGEVESVFLNSAKKYLKSFFKKPPLRHNQCPNDNTQFFESYRVKDRVKITSNGQYSLFLNHQNKSELYLTSHENSFSSSRFRSSFVNKFGFVSLYKTNTALYVDKSTTSEKSLQKCWTNTVPGSILKLEFSPDKSSMAVYYRIIVNSDLVYRIRYFHALRCDFKGKMKNADKQVKDNLFRAIEEHTQGEDYTNSYLNGLKHKQIVLESYYNDELYDDFSIPGNSPIEDLAISTNLLAYARDLDTRQFYLLKRNNRNRLDNNNKSSIWEVAYSGKHSSNLHFFKTKILMFLEDEKYAFKLMHIFLSSNDTNDDITHTNISVVKSDGSRGRILVKPTNYTNFTKEAHSNGTLEGNRNTSETSSKSDFNIEADEYNLTYINLTISESSIIENWEEDIHEGKSSDYQSHTTNLPQSIESHKVAFAKRMQKPSVSSVNSGSPNIVIEIFQGFLLSFDYNKNTTTNQTHHVVYDLLKSEYSKRKISLLSSDYSNRNIIIKYRDSPTLTYVYRNKDDFATNNIIYEVVKMVSLKKIPKRYKNREFKAFIIENISDKVIFFGLNDDGVLISLDFTKIEKKFIGSNNFLWFFVNDFNYVSTVILGVDLLTCLAYYIYSRRRNTQELVQRSNELNSIISEIIQLSNRNGNENVNTGNNELPNVNNELNEENNHGQNAENQYQDQENEDNDENSEDNEDDDNNEDVHGSSNSNAVPLTENTRNNLSAQTAQSQRLRRVDPRRHQNYQRRSNTSEETRSLTELVSNLTTGIESLIPTLNNVSNELRQAIELRRSQRNEQREKEIKEKQEQEMLQQQQTEKEQEQEMKRKREQHFQVLSNSDSAKTNNAVNFNNTNNNTSSRTSQPRQIGTERRITQEDINLNLQQLMQEFNFSITETGRFVINEPLENNGPLTGTSCVTGRSDLCWRKFSTQLKKKKKGEMLFIILKLKEMRGERKKK